MLSEFELEVLAVKLAAKIRKQLELPTPSTSLDMQYLASLPADERKAILKERTK